MGFAIFPGDDYYHLVKSQSNYTLCGLPTLKRDRGGEEYRPRPAYRMRPRPPHYTAPAHAASLRPMHRRRGAGMAKQREASASSPR
jgi:hypothetical protein